MKYRYLIAMIALVVAAVVLTITGCTDTTRASIGAYGSSGHITCWSASTVIIDTVSTGRIQTVANSDGWEFKDSKTGRFTRVSGPCVIVN